MKEKLSESMQNIVLLTAKYWNILSNYPDQMTSEAQSELTYFLARELPEVLFKNLEDGNSLQVKAFIGACNKQFPDEFVSYMYTGFSLYVVDRYVRQQHPDMMKTPTPPKKVLDLDKFAKSNPNRPQPKTDQRMPDSFDPISVWSKLMK